MGETEAQAGDGHVTNPCEGWDRNANGLILAGSFLFLLASPSSAHLGVTMPVEDRCTCLLLRHLADALQKNRVEDLREKQTAPSTENQQKGHRTGLF